MTLIGAFDSIADLLVWQNIAIVTDFTGGHFIKSSTRIKVALETERAINVTLIDLSRGVDKALTACITAMSFSGELGRYCLNCVSCWLHKRILLCVTLTSE